MEFGFSTVIDEKRTRFANLLPNAEEGGEKFL